MLIDILFIFYFFLWDLVFGIIPNVGILPVELPDSAADLIRLTFGWNWLVPVDTLWRIFAISIVVCFLEFSFRLVRWLLNLIRGSGA